MNSIKNISIIFMSIFFETLPFLLLGAFISSIIERYISDDLFERLIPKNVVLGSFVGVFLGFFIPACDCAVIPVTKRLIKKKMPLNVAISFMLASPIINPVVLLSTYYAFYRTNIMIFYLRLILGILVSLIVGIIVGLKYKGKPVLKNTIEEIEEEMDEHCSCDHGCCCHHHDHEDESSIKFIVKHTAFDVYDIIKYLVFGAFIAASFQVLTPINILEFFQNSKILSIIFLMIFAYLNSLCSTSDSFVGRTLLSSFNKPSIMAYLLLGPMIDVKNTVVLFGNYRREFVIDLIKTIFLVVFIFSFIGALV